MTTTNFEVKPLRRYDGARYPGVCVASAPRAEEGGEDPGPGVAATLLRFALVLGMALGLVACFDDSDYQIERPRHPDDVEL